MGGETPCSIYSYFKQNFGFGTGTLLMVVMEDDKLKLVFNGKEENSSTIFFSKYSRGLSTFYITVDKTKYGLCFENNGIILKEKGGTRFKVEGPLSNCSIIYQPTRSKTEMCLTCEKDGTPTFLPRDKVHGNIGKFYIKNPTYDHNNNNLYMEQVIEKCIVYETGV